MGLRGKAYYGDRMNIWREMNAAEHGEHTARMLQRVSAQYMQLAAVRHLRLVGVGRHQAQYERVRSEDCAK